MRYSDLTRRYFESTPALGVLLREGVPAAQGVFRGNAGRRERGTWVQFDLQVQGGHVLDARFLAFGCPHTIAAASWVAEQASGSSLRAALPEPVHALRERFAIPQEKLGRLLIVEDAWLAATRAAIDSAA
jgi:NifU-like protein involved in Fe-S cluster formation